MQKISKMHLSWTAKLIGILFVSIGLSAALTYAAPGDLDKTFNSDGYVQTDLATLFGGASAVAIDTQGRIVVVGTSFARAVIVRYLPNGLRDSSFANNGVLIDDMDFEGFGIMEPQVIVDASGKILLLANAQSDGLGYNHMIMLRFNDNGSRDTTLGTGGMVVTPKGDFPQAVALDDSGRIVTTGPSFTSPDNGFLARYLPDGSGDPTFGDNGRIVTTNLVPAGLVLANDGSVFVAGFRYLGSEFNDGDLIITKYTSDGALDTSFGTDGVTYSDFDGLFEHPRAMIEDSSGRLVVAGYTEKWLPGTPPGDYTDFILARYNPDGSPDTTFGSGGKIRTDFDHQGNAASDLVIQADHRLLVVGSSAGRSAVARYNDDGTLDTSFGIGGLRIDGQNDAFNGFNAAALDADQKLIAVGSSILVTRYETGGAARTELLVNGGFETAGATPKLPANWTGEKLKNDVRKCKKSSAKAVAFAGKCALKFIGSNHESSKFIQEVDPSSVSAGDVLSLSAWVRNNQDDDGWLGIYVYATLKYSDGSTDKMILDLNDQGTWYWQSVAPDLSVTQPINQITVEVWNRSNAGKLLVDQVSLSKIPGESVAVVQPESLPAIPLP